MSFSRRITLSVILTLVVSGMSTVFCALEAEAAQEEAPVLHTPPVVQGPYRIELPAKAALKKVVRLFTALPKVNRAMSAIVTREKVVNQFRVIQANGNAATVIDFAMQQIGDPYVWGGNGPNGWDCSGLMVGAFSQIGVDLPRTSRAQFTVGSPVAYGQWAPGDLLFYGSSASEIHHVVLYIGNGQIIHASTFGVPVKIDTVKGGGNDYYGARRII